MEYRAGSGFNSGGAFRNTLIVGDIERPNGLCFALDEATLYIYRRDRFVVEPDLGLCHCRRPADAAPRFIDAGKGTPDGLRCDVDGNVPSGWGMDSDELDGVRCLAPDGVLIGRISLPERCANRCFGEVKHNRLFMAASHWLLQRTGHGLSLGGPTAILFGLQVSTR